MFKEASKIKLRVPTSKGNLSVEQLWDLNLSDLTDAIISINKLIGDSKINNDDDLSFLENSENKINTKDQIAFEILKTIYLDKKNKIEESKLKLQQQIHNKRIMEIIADKEEKGLYDKSIDELKAMLA